MAGDKDKDKKDQEKDMAKFMESEDTKLWRAYVSSLESPFRSKPSIKDRRKANQEQHEQEQPNQEEINQKQSSQKQLEEKGELGGSEFARMLEQEVFFIKKETIAKQIIKQEKPAKKIDTILNILSIAKNKTLDLMPGNNTGNNTSKAIHNLSSDNNPSQAKFNNREIKNIIIDSVLDLHWLTLDQAESRLINFINLAQKRSYRWVLVITGKGKNPEDQSVGGPLRKFATRWLEENTTVVVGFMPARPKHGGTGAFYVRIRKPKR